MTWAATGRPSATCRATCRARSPSTPAGPTSCWRARRKDVWRSQRRAARAGRAARGRAGRPSASTSTRPARPRRASASPRRRRASGAPTTAGATWAEKSAGLPWRGLRSFCGGSNAAEKVVLLYCAVPGKAVGRRVRRRRLPVRRPGRVLAVRHGAPDEHGHQGGGRVGHGRRGPVSPRPDDQRAARRRLRAATPTRACSRRTTRPRTAPTTAARAGGRPSTPTRASARCNVEQDYMTAGERQFFQDVPTGAAIDPSNPDRVMQVDGGRCYITSDGGKTLAGRAHAPDGRRGPHEQGRRLALHRAGGDHHVELLHRPVRAAAPLHLLHGHRLRAIAGRRV